jgi:leucine dehydrogenase
LDDISAIIKTSGAAEVLTVEDASCGLHAFIVLDDERLGPAAGGIRTRTYPSAGDALRDALGLARSMTIKCALAGLEAGGGKCVVLDHAGLDRPAAFAALGDAIAALAGRFHTAGDLGTTVDDLRRARARSGYVHVDDGDLGLAAAVGQTVLAGVRAALGLDADGTLDGVRVGVQGVGAIGGAVARALADARATLQLADLDGAAASALAHALGATVVSTHDPARWAVDVLAPCAVGGILGADEAAALRARAVVGGANGIVRTEEAAAVAEVLRARDIVFVPDVLSSSGAVIAGIARTVMHIDPAPLLDGVGQTTRRVLDKAAAEGTPTWEAAKALARERLAAAGADETLKA